MESEDILYKKKIDDLDWIKNSSHSTYINNNLTELYKCSYSGCEMLFNKKYILRDHLRAHKKEKPWKCNHAGCTKGFTQSGNLKIHKKIHFNANVFYCNYPNCFKAFSARHYLKIHIKSHLGEKPFKCPFTDCDRSYYDRGNLRYHEKTVHSDEICNFTYSCIHTNCNMRFKTIKEKLEHHWDNDDECKKEVQDYFGLLKKMSEVYSQLEIDSELCEGDVNLLAQKLESTKSNSGISDVYLNSSIENS